MNKNKPTKHPTFWERNEHIFIAVIGTIIAGIIVIVTSRTLWLCLTILAAAYIMQPC